MSSKHVFYFFLVLGIGLSACNQKNKVSEKKNDATESANKNLPKTFISLNKSKAIPNDSFIISLELKNEIRPDSLHLLLDNKLHRVLLDINDTLLFELKNAGTGNHSFLLKAFKDSSFSISSANFIVYAANKPMIFDFKVKKTMPHDKTAFTQGFFYENGFFYEATGLKGESSLRKVNPATGQVLNSFSIPSNIFGEGVTAFQNKIVQLSWSSGIGFVYNKSDFKLIEQFNYSTEGWGLTTDSTFLIMSDGTNILYFLDPNNYTEVKRLQVYDNKKAVDQLNELEFIEGKIWANIYLTDKIAIINPIIGNVEAYIELDNILDKSLYLPDTDVLNGIAFDKNLDKIFVTGKKWPLIFEIEIFEKSN